MLRDLIAWLKRPYGTELAQFRAAAGVSKTVVVDAAVDLPNILANVTGSIDVVVAGAKTTQAVSFQLKDDLPAGVSIVGVRITAANTVRVLALNHTAAPVNAASVAGRFLLTGE